MEHYNPGDHSKAICEDCNKLVDTTFVVRNVPFDDGIGVAKNILVAVCDLCDQTVAIPAQSVATIAEARKEAESSTSND